MFCVPLLACSQPKNIAVEGYDLISYFDQKAEEGKPQYKVHYNGKEYYFATSEHQIKFKQNPQQYLPQYGGWCAYAMGLDGSKVEINPKSYKVIDNKLYLFYKTALVDTKSKWDKNEEMLMKQADINWKHE